MWLISRTVPCFVILAVLIGAAIFIGHRQPVSPLVRAWRLDECVRPCWMGIVPGQSTVPEAYQQVTAILQTFGYTLDPLGFSWDDLGVFLKISDRTGQIDPNAIITFAGQTHLLDELGIWRGQTDAIMPTFGDFVSLFGSPTCLTSSKTLNAVVLLMYYNDANDKSTFGVVMDASRFSWTQPIYGFSIGQNVNPAFANTCATQSRTIPWHGLASAAHYIAEMH
jgi:hypothetical protein